MRDHENQRCGVAARASRGRETAIRDAKMRVTATIPDRPGASLFPHPGISYRGIPPQADTPHRWFPSSRITTLSIH